MTDKKKRSKTKKVEPQKFTAVKLVIHQASIQKGGPYRYVIAGMIVSEKPMDNFPVDCQTNLVYEDVELETFGFSLGSLIHTTLSGMKTRPVKVSDGMSMDQFLLSLPEV